MAAHNRITLGERSGNLVVIACIEKDPRPGHGFRWLTLCSCGNTQECTSMSFRRRISCIKCSDARGAAKRVSHGDSGRGAVTRLNRIWKAMKSRCRPGDHYTARWYAKKGITVCSEWQAYEPFREWALSHGYADNLTIDRLKTSEGYSPENCRWITQSANSKKAAVEKAEYIAKLEAWYAETAHLRPE